MIQPEGIGGERNWDYRYTWIRDAAFTLYGFMRIGFIDEARHFFEWLEKYAYKNAAEEGTLQLMYRIDGSSELEEYELKHLKVSLHH